MYLDTNTIVIQLVLNQMYIFDFFFYEKKQEWW